MPARSLQRAFTALLFTTSWTGPLAAQAPGGGAAGFDCEMRITQEATDGRGRLRCDPTFVARTRA